MRSTIAAILMEVMVERSEARGCDVVEGGCRCTEGIDHRSCYVNAEACWWWDMDSRHVACLVERLIE